MNRMFKPAFGEQNRNWYRERGMLNTRKLLVVIKIRESLCGVRGQCVCRVEKPFL